VIVFVTDPIENEVSGLAFPNVSFRTIRPFFAMATDMASEVPAATWSRAARESEAASGAEDEPILDKMTSMQRV
jgi:hypothetical protein